MYLDAEEIDKLATYCKDKRPYLYLKRINYLNSDIDNSNEDYLGVAIYPTLYSSTCTIEECKSGSDLYYNNVYVIRNPSRQVCIAVIKGNQTLYIPKRSHALHTLYILREIAKISLEYLDLVVEVKDPKLLKVYKSRMAFGDKINKLSLDIKDNRYRVKRNI